SRVGEEHERDRRRRQCCAYPRQSLRPDHDEGREGEQDGHHGNGGAPRKGWGRGADFGKPGAQDNAGEEGGHESKGGHAPRPDGEPRGWLRLEVMARHRLPHQAEQTIPACAAETVASKVVMRSLSWRTSR